MSRWTLRDKNRMGEPPFTFTGTSAELEQFLEDNPSIIWLPDSGLPTVDSVRIGRQKPDDNFRDLLRTIKKGSPGSDVNTF
jgi:hypothetical protein